MTFFFFLYPLPFPSTHYPLVITFYPLVITFYSLSTTHHSLSFFPLYLFLHPRIHRSRSLSVEQPSCHYFLLTIHYPPLSLFLSPLPSCHYLLLTIHHPLSFPSTRYLFPYPRIHRSRSLSVEQGSHGDPLSTSLVVQKSRATAGIRLCGE